MEIALRLSRTISSDRENFLNLKREILNNWEAFAFIWLQLLTTSFYNSMKFKAEIILNMTGQVGWVGRFREKIDLVEYWFYPIYLTIIRDLVNVTAFMTAFGLIYNYSVILAIVFVIFTINFASSAAHFDIIIEGAICRNHKIACNFSFVSSSAYCSIILQWNSTQCLMIF